MRNEKYKMKNNEIYIKRKKYKMKNKTRNIYKEK